MGHATRCVPIINELINQNAEPVIAAYGKGYEFLKNEFKHLTIIKLPGFKLTYPRSKLLRLKIILWLPVLFFTIIRENFSLRKLIKNYNINVVISDGRYGLYSHEIPSVFVTHQVLIKLPGIIRFLEYPIYLMNRSIINKFTFRWFPDIEGEPNLSGDLCHKYNTENDTFIGPLNRFTPFADTENRNHIDALIIISGLEKQRSVFEEIVFLEVKNCDKKIVVLQGIPGSERNFEINQNVKVYSHLDSRSIYKLIDQSDLVICRSGYTTIMELSAIGKKAVLVPTPGQTEQEYLAAYYEKKMYTPFFTQDKFNLKEAFEKVGGYAGIPKIGNPDLLKHAVNQLLDQVKRNLNKAS